MVYNSISSRDTVIYLFNIYIEDKERYVRFENSHSGKIKLVYYIF